MRVLEGRRQETMANFAFQFGVSIRTVNYDIETLTATYPIETVRGKGGCVRLMNDYKSYKGDISEEQQLTLLEAIPLLSGKQAKVVQELLRAHGSRRNKEKIEGVLTGI
jgi:predicted DNA-binding transcriptional regulator YafY